MSARQRAEESDENMARHAWYAWVDSKASCVLLDGGLGSILSERGNDLSQGSMWSGRMLHSNPEEIRAVAWEWLTAGSDIITTATYQLSEDLVRRELKMSEEKARRFMITAWNLADDARNQFWSTLSASERERRRYPKIAVSFGPLSAIRADTNEYSGIYENVSTQDFKDFHKRRASMFVRSLNLSNATVGGVLCYETFGNAAEAVAVADIMSQPELRGIPYWISFQCRDDSRLASGASLSSVVHNVLEACHHMNLVAIGVNCVEVCRVKALVGILRSSLDHYMSCDDRKSWRVDTIAYPNSGESYVDGSWTWAPGQRLTTSSWALKLWACNGKILGGCCRTLPSHISALNTVRNGERRRSVATKMIGPV